MGTRVEPVVSWSPDEKWIAYLRKDDDLVSLWRSSANGETTESLFTDERFHVRDFAWSADGRSLVINVVPTQDYLMELHQSNENGGFFFDDRFLVAWDNKPRFQSGDGSKTLTLALESKLTKPATPADESLLVEDRPSFLPNSRKVAAFTKSEEGNRIAWLESTSSEQTISASNHRRIFLSHNKDGTDYQSCNAPECSGFILGVWWMNGELVFLKREGYRDTFYSFYGWEPKTNTIRSIYQSEHEVFIDCNLTIKGLACLRESWSEPRRIVLIDTQTREVSTVYNPNSSWDDLSKPRVEKIHWGSDKRTESHGHLVYPKNYNEGQRYPLVIIQYRSRGFLRGGTGDEYPIFPLSSQGYFVLSFDRPTRRESWMNKERLDELARSNWREFDFRDRMTTVRSLDAIIEILTEKGLIDSGKIAITGLSDGAETVNFAIRYSENYAAAIATHGGFSPHAYHLLNESSRKYLKNQAHLDIPGRSEEIDSRWEYYSPDLGASDIDTPLMLQVSDSELAWSVQMHVALKEYNKPVATYVFPDEYHIKFHPRHRKAAYERAIDWINFWLQKYENPDPKKAAQYDRWRKLRELRDQNVRPLN